MHPLLSHRVLVTFRVRQQLPAAHTRLRSDLSGPAAYSASIRKLRIPPLSYRKYTNSLSNTPVLLSRPQKSLQKVLAAATPSGGAKKNIKTTPVTRGKKAEEIVKNDVDSAAGANEDRIDEAAGAAKRATSNTRFATTQDFANG